MRCTAARPGTSGHRADSFETDEGDDRCAAQLATVMTLRAVPPEGARPRHPLRRRPTSSGSVWLTPGSNATPSTSLKALALARAGVTAPTYDPSVRIGLVGCVKSKRSTPTRAKDLYTSTLFVGRRRHVEASCDQWFVLSALYGLVDPDRVVEPYEVTLADQSEDHRRAWARSVVDQLRRRLGTLNGVEFEIHAGAAYRDHGLVDGLRTLGATVELPTEGLNFGQQLAFYCNGQPERSTGRSTYTAIGSYLRGREPPVDLSIDEVSGILGRPLTPSALRYREWWANTDRSPQGRGWLAANWKVASVDLVGRRVTFTSLTPAPGRAAIPPAYEAPALSTSFQPQVASVRDLRWRAFEISAPSATDGRTRPKSSTAGGRPRWR